MRSHFFPLLVSIIESSFRLYYMLPQIINRSLFNSVNSLSTSCSMQSIQYACTAVYLLVSLHYVLVIVLCQNLKLAVFLVDKIGNCYKVSKFRHITLLVPDRMADKIKKEREIEKKWKLLISCQSHHRQVLFFLPVAELAGDAQSLSILSYIILFIRC